MESNYRQNETSLIRQIALDLLEQAYQSNPSQTLSRERANQLEALIARHIGGSIEDFNKVRTGIALDRYIDLIIDTGLHLSEQTWTGFCSRQINHLLRGNELPLDLPNWNRVKFFPELHFNQSLSVEEKLSCLKRIDRERTALHRAFKSALTIHDFEPIFFGSEDDLYSNYYEQVCLEEGCRIVKRPPPNQLFIELIKGEIKVFTISTRRLLESFSERINPLIGTPYSTVTLQRIRGKFQIELKLLNGR